MSLLDDVSIVVTPNGYKAGELYAVIPSDGAADMDVTRATAATRVDENGLVNYAEIVGKDLITDGEFPSNTNWNENNAACEIIGGKAVWTSAPNSTGFLGINLNDNICEIGKTYKVTYTIDSVTEGKIRIRYPDFGTQYNSSGTYPLTVTNTLTATSTDIYFQCLQTTTASISNVSVKEVTRDNVPRIDYTGGGCPHILAEPMRTNLIPYSEDLTEWNTGNSTIAANDIVSPDGTQNADTITVPDSNEFIYESITTTESTEYVFSFYVKRGTIAESALKLAVYDDTANSFIVVDVSYSASDSEWTRVTQSFTTPVGCILIRAYAFRNSSSTLGTFSVWGGQVEAGSYATSYIPNFGTAAGVTRNQDIFTRDGIGSLINSTEGVLFVEMAALANDGSYRILSLSDGTDDERIYIQYTSTTNQVSAVVKEEGDTQANIAYTLTDATEFHKIAFKWKLNDFALWIDGVEVGTDTSGSVPSGLNRLALDRQLDLNTLYAKVKQLQVYDTALGGSPYNATLSDDRLRALTS